MIKNTSISRCLKTDFKAFEQINDKTFKISWGKNDEVIGDSVSEWCNYESGIYVGILTPHFLDESLSIAKRSVSVYEYKEIYDCMGLDDKHQFLLLKDKLKDDIKRYDKSNNVEDIVINGTHIWLNHDLRGKIKENLEISQQLNEEYITLRFDGLSFNIPIDLAWKLYYMVIEYARDCWNVTEMHLTSAETLNNIEEIINYNYKIGYPEKLTFNI